MTRSLSPISWLCLAALALVLAALILLPVDTAERNLVARTGGVLAAIAMLLFVTRLPSDTRSIWLLFWLYQFSVVIGDLIYNYQQLTMGELPFPGLADAPYMLSYFFAWAGLVILAHRIDPRRNFEVAVDSMVIGLAVLTLVGSLVIGPLVDAAEKWDLGLAFSIAYPVLDVFVFAALVRLYLLSPVHNVALLTLSAAMLLFLLLDLGYYYYLYVFGTELDIEIPWMVALALMAAAASFPSARKVATRVQQDEHSITRGRAAIVAASVLVPLTLAVVDHLRKNEIRDLWNLFLGVAVVVLVLWRGYRLLKTTQQQNIELERLVQAEAEIRREAIAAWQAADSASKAKSQFLSVMSHELRTPLTAIMGMFQLIEMNGTSSKLREFAAKGLKSADHLLALVSEILDFSSIEVGRLSVVSKPFQLETLLDDVSRLAATPRRAGVNFEIHLDQSLQSLELIGDELRLKQVLINLLGNAVKFTDSGTVGLSVKRTGGTPEAPQIEFAITDTGIGMTPDQQSKLFQPFTQVDMSNVRRFGGTGLGLSISQRLVSLMGGSPISIESEPNAGSRFAFHLTLSVADRALAPKASDDRAHPAVPAGRLDGCHLLLVDDNEVIRFAVRLLLETEGAIVEEAEDGARGVSAALAAATPHDAVLMDMQMPDMLGVDAARTLRARGYTRPIIGMTANAFANDRETCLAAGMNDYISKPVKVEDLVGALQRSQRD